jgi:long-subunit fatty acid transport protein
MALFAGKNGFITADVTYSTYNTIRFSSSGTDFGGENDFISRNYQPTIHARIGGEYRKNIFRARAGAGYQTDPYKDLVDDLNRARLNFSAGAGIRLPEFYIDLAVVHSRFDNGYTPYTISTQDTPSVIVKNRLTNVVLSFGMFF